MQYHTQVGNARVQVGAAPVKDGGKANVNVKAEPCEDLPSVTLINPSESYSRPTITSFFQFEVQNIIMLQWLLNNLWKLWVIFQPGFLKIGRPEVKLYGDWGHMYFKTGSLVIHMLICFAL